MVACHENGKENAMRLIKHFSSECKDDWKMESDLVNELGETEHPNILTYSWHGEGIYLAVFFFLFSCFDFGNVTFCVELCFSGGYLENSEKIRVPKQGAEHMTFQLFSTNHWAAGGPRMSEAL